MLELFGFAWVTITFTACVGAIATRRSVRGWLAARADRRRHDDTVEIVRRPLRKVATYTALVVLALPAGVLAGGGALPGPRGGGGGLPTTGGTMTGQVVFSGVSTDISTASGESFVVAPAGAGGIGLQATTGSIDMDVTTGSATLDCTTASGNGCLKITHTETNGTGLWVDSPSGNNVVRLRTAAASGMTWIDFQTSASARAGLIGYANASFAGADVADKMVLFANGKVISVLRDDNVAAGSPAFTVEDDCTLAGATCVRQFSVDGNGAAKFRDMTSAHGATCNATTEGSLYYRSISASDKSGFCVCAETSNGVYGWKMGMTFGSSALTDGDC